VNLRGSVKILTCCADNCIFFTDDAGVFGGAKRLIMLTEKIKHNAVRFGNKTTSLMFLITFSDMTKYYTFSTARQ